MCAGVLVFVAACSSSPDTPFCGVKQVVAPSASSEPGTLQFGVLHSPADFLTAAHVAPVVARSDGSVLCATCSGIVAFDAMLHETGRVDLGPEGRGFVANLAVGPDDAVYAVVPGGILIRIDDLAHVSTVSEARWRTPVELGIGVLVAGTEGPYAELENGFEIRGFDAVTGQSRTVASGQNLLAAARGGGVFTVEHPGKQSAILHRLDPAGTVVWSRTLTATFDGLAIDGAAATADGGVVVFGYTPTALDLGDRSLASPGAFVASFDASGATQWALASPVIASVTQTARGDLLIAGQTGLGGGAGLASTDGFLSVVTPAGISRKLDITGPGDQVILGLAPAPDGSVWIDIGNFRHDDPPAPAPAIQIGDHTFSEAGSYLFKIVL